MPMSNLPQPLRFFGSQSQHLCRHVSTVDRCPCAAIGGIKGSLLLQFPPQPVGIWPAAGVGVAVHRCNRLAIAVHTEPAHGETGPCNC